MNFFSSSFEVSFFFFGGRSEKKKKKGELGASPPLSFPLSLLFSHAQIRGCGTRSLSCICCCCQSKRQRKTRLSLCATSATDRGSLIAFVVVVGLFINLSACFLSCCATLKQPRSSPSARQEDAFRRRRSV